MKKSTKFRLLIAALLLITGSNLFSQAVTWDFPVKPGTEKWKSFTTSYEMIDACQVPADVLAAISTDKLIEACLDYPLILDIMAFDNMLAGLEAYTTNFNGFRELIKRSDAAKVLVQKYREKDPLAVEKDWSSFESFLYAKRISMMELFLCNKEILSQLGTDEKKDLMNEYRLKKSQKNNMIDLYKSCGFQTIYLAMVKLLESENVNLSRDINMDNVTPYITAGILKSREIFKEINNAVNNYLLDDLSPISEESSYYEDNIRMSVQANVYTPKGHTVYATIDDEMTERERHYWDSTYLHDYPNAIQIITYGGYSSTSRFNCHGYAWHVSERGLTNSSEYRQIGGEEIYWMDKGTNSSYVQIGNSLQYPFSGGITPPSFPAKIRYSGLDHSAVIADPSIYPPSQENPYRVISKWGPYGPLVCHNIDYCPFVTAPQFGLYYYRLNPKMSGVTNPPLCKDSERTFSTDITHLPQALTWAKSGPIAYLRQTDSTYTVKGSGIGSAKVKLEILTLSGFTWSDSIQFQAIDKPLISNQMVDGSAYYYGMGVSPGSHMLSFVPYPDNGSTTETWTVPSGIQYHIYQGEHKLGFYFLTNPSLTFTVKATNACGTGPVSTYYLTRQRGLIMTLYPNPASDNVTITMTEKIPSTEYCDTTGFISETITDTYTQSVESTTFTIRIYNSQSELLYTCKRSGRSFNIPLVNLKDGTYIIEVSDGETYYRQQLIIKHN